MDRSPQWGYLILPQVQVKVKVSLFHFTVVGTNEDEDMGT